MWPFNKTPETRRTLKPLRPCWCGQSSYGWLRSDDAVHCNHCGTMFLFGPFVVDPVAKVEYIKETSEEG